VNDISDSQSWENRSTGGRLVPLSQSVPTLPGGYGRNAEYPTTGSEASGLGANLYEYWRVLKKRKWIILSVITASVAIGILLTLMTTPLYTSTVRLQIDRNVAKVVEGGNVTPLEGADFEFMKTQYELLMGRAIGERVVSALKLGEDAEFLKPREFSLIGALVGLLASRNSSDGQASGSARRETAAAGVVIDNRVVRPVSGSRLVDVSYSDPVPARAQRIAKAFADAFINSTIDKRFQANSYAKVFLEDQAKQLKLRLEESEKVLLEFGQREQIVSVTEKSSIAENNLASANVTLGALASERIKNEELWRQAESAKALNLPQFLSNSVIDGLRAKRNLLETEYQEKLETFKPSYPAMVQISNKIAEIDRQLASEVNTIKLALKGGYESSLSQEAEMKKRIESLRGEVLDLQKRSIEYNILKREVDTNRTLYDGLLQRYKEVDIAGGVGANNVFIVDKAELPQFPSSPRMSRALLISFALGSAAGIGAAYLLELLDDTVRTADDLERITGLTTLGIIPKNEGAKTLDAEFADPRSHISEACRSLCTALQFSTDTGLPKTLLVTSSGPGEGKSTTALVIARHFATMGLRVLLVDGDLRKPSMHVKLGLDNGTGLTNFLTGALSPPEVIQNTVTPNLTFIASGPLPPNAADLLGSARMLSLLAVGVEVFDFIIIDSPPVMGLADAPLLSSMAAATIFVAGSGQVRTGLIRNAIKRLLFARGSVIGAVITKFDTRHEVGYGYGYGYGYSYGHGYGYGPENGDDQPKLRPAEIEKARVRKSKLQVSG
jgi:polysaccharide biosynthesis transport protein